MRHAAGPVLRQIPQQDIARHAEIVRAALAAGVIKHDAEIRLGGAREPLFDLLPRRQPVAQTDDGKVVRERRAEQRAAAARGGEAGDDLDLRLGCLAAQLIEQRRHAVNAAVAGADHRNGLSAARRFERHFAALHLAQHRRGEKFLIRVALLHEIDVHGIPDDHVALAQRAVGADRHIFIVSGADAHNSQLTQSAPPNVLPPPPRSRRCGRSFLPITFRRFGARLSRTRCPRR